MDPHHHRQKRKPIWISFSSLTAQTRLTPRKLEKNGEVAEKTQASKARVNRIPSDKSVSQSTARIHMMSHYMTEPSVTLTCPSDFHDTLLARLISFSLHSLYQDLTPWYPMCQIGAFCL